LDTLVETVRDAARLEGSVGVIVPDAMTDEIQKALHRNGVMTNLVEVNTDHGVAIVPASAAKGMEYDSVVLVEPAAIVAMENRRADGLRRLYVSLTRAVSRMVVVHDQPLPPELRHAGSLSEQTPPTR
jgi:DNA helicase IV